MAEFLAAVEALGSQDAERRAAGHEWLASLKTSPEAWSICAAVLQQSTTTDVLFHACNVLLIKVKADGKTLPASQRQVLLTVVRNTLTSATYSNTPTFALEKVCSLHARLEFASGAAQTAQWLQQCTGALKGARPEGVSQGKMCLHVLKAAAQQLVEMDVKSRQALAAAVTSERSAEVLVAVDSVLQWCTGDSMMKLALQTMAAWLGASPDPAASCAWSVGEFCQLCPEGISHIAAGLKFEECTEAAQDALQTLLATPAPRNDPAAHAAVRSLVSFLKHTLHEASQAAGTQKAAQPPQDIFSACASLSTACMESAAWLAADADFAELFGLLFHVAHGQSLGYVTECLDCLLAISTIPVAERLPQLGPHLFGSVVKQVLPWLMYPEGYYGQDDGEFDVEDFRNFRERDGVDLVQHAFEESSVSFISSIVHTFETATDWRQLELAMFCMSALASHVRRRLMVQDSQPSAQQGHEQQAALQRSLAAFASLLVCHQQAAIMMHNLTCTAACKVIADYTFWFGAVLEAPAQEALAMCLKLMLESDACVLRPPACTAFRNLLVHRQSLRTMPVAQEGCQRLSELLDQVSIGGTPATADEDSRATGCLSDVTEGLVRLAVALTADDQERLLLGLCQMLIQRMTAALEGTAPAKHASLALHLLSTLLRFVDAPTDPQTAAGSITVRLVQAAWGTLQAVTQSNLVLHGAALEPLCDAVSGAVTAAGAARGNLIAPAVELVQGLFTHKKEPTVLMCVAVIAELTGGEHGGTAEQRQRLYELLPVLLQAVANVHGNEATPELYAAMLRLLSRWALFHPGDLYQRERLRQALTFAVAALRMRERPVVQGVMQLLVMLLTPNQVQTERLIERRVSQDALNELVLEQCEALVQHLLVCLCTTCPQDSWLMMGRLLYGMMAAPVYGRAVVECLCRVLSSDWVAVQTTPLTADDCQAFIQICGRLNELGQMRFKAAVGDLAGIAHGVCASDALLGYLM